MRTERDVVGMIQKELDNLKLPDLMATVCDHPDMKIAVHKIIMDYAKGAEERFNLTKHEFGQLVALEGLVIMSAATANTQQ